MHVQRDRCLRLLRFFMNSFKIAGTERIIPDRRSRIAGVTGPRPIIAGEEFLANVQFLAHTFEAGSAERHVTVLIANKPQKSAESLCPPSRPQSAGQFQ